MPKTSYEYMMAIVEAIEKYVGDKEEYSALFARELYFEIINLHDTASMVLAGSTDDERIMVRNQAIKDVLSIAFPVLISRIVVKQSIKAQIKKMVYSSRFATNLFLFLRSFGKTQDLPKASYAFVVIHHKFIRYLAPIFEPLLHDAVFVICGDEQASVALCSELRFRYIVGKHKAKIKITTKPQYMLYRARIEEAKAILSVMSVKKVVLAEGNAPHDELYNLASHELGITTLCIQQGWSPIYHNGFRNMHYDLFLAWGEEFIKLLQSYSPNQKFVATGSHILYEDKEVSYATAISFFLQGVTLLITQKIFDEFLELAIWTAKTYSHRQIIIREHPSHQIDNDKKDMIKNLPNIEIQNNDKYTLDQVLSQSQIAVSIYSTVLLEAIQYGAVPFIYNPTQLPFYEPDLSSLGAGIEVKSLDQAKELMIEIVNNQNQIDSLREKCNIHRDNFFRFVGDDARNKIINEITSEKL